MDRKFWNARVYLVLLSTTAAACGRGSSLSSDGPGAGLSGTGGATSTGITSSQGARSSGGRGAEPDGSASGGDVEAGGGFQANGGEQGSGGEGAAPKNDEQGGGGARSEGEAERGSSGASGAGGSGAPGAGAETGPRPWKLVFIAPGPFPSDFARGAGTRGIGAHVRADALCQQTAIDAGLQGSYHAWLSTSTAGALEYFAAYGMNGPWYRSDDELVAANLSELVSQRGLRAPLLYGPDKLPAGMVWTGTGPLGVVASNCEDFTSNENDGSLAAYCALATKQDFGWSSSALIACGATGRGLACFER